MLSVRPAIWLTLFIAIVLAAACDKVPLLAPTQSTITLSITTTTLPINGTAEVIATVTEQPGTPVQNGTEVTFIASLGTMEPSSALTQGGQARATFRAGTQSGTARINAFSGPARTTPSNGTTPPGGTPPTPSSGGELTVAIGAAAAESITVRTDPTSVPQSGGTVQVIAIVVDLPGNPLPGVPVSFSTDVGQLGATQVQTDLAGEARTTLNTNRQSIVTARVAAKPPATATITLITAPTVSITGPTTPQNVGIAVPFTVTPSAPGTTGNPIQGVTVDYGDGSPVQSLGAITGATPISHIYTRENNYLVTAFITDITGQRNQASTNVTVGRAIPTATITATPTTVNTGEPVTFTVNATPGTGGPPISGVEVTFSDGQGNRTVGAGSSFTRSFSTAGTHEVTATPIDTSGTRGTPQRTSVLVRQRASLEVNVDAASADGAFTVTCLPATVYPKTCTVTGGLFTPVGSNPRVNLQATVPNVPTGDSILSYVWDFDDGSQQTTSTRGTDHVFQRGAFGGARTYVVTVVVTTAAGSTGNGRITLNVQ